MIALDFYAGIAVGVFATFGFNVAANIALFFFLRWLDRKFCEDSAR